MERRARKAASLLDGVELDVHLAAALTVRVSPWRVLGLVAVVTSAVLLIQLLGGSRLQLGQVGPLLLVVVAGWYLATLLLRALRWKLLISPVAKVPLLASFAALAFGGLASMIGPAHVGTVVRGVHLSKATSAPVSASLVSAAADRVLDMLLWLLLLPPLILGWPRSLAALLEGVSRLDVHAPVTPVAIVLATCGALALIAALAIAQRRWRDSWDRIVGGLKPLMNARTGGLALLPTVGLIGLDLAALVAVARLLGLALPPGTAAPLWVVIGIARGISIAGRVAPWGLLGLGLQHGLLFAALAALGVSAEQAAMYVLTIYAALALVTVSAGGIVALSMLGGGKLSGAVPRRFWEGRRGT